MDDVEHKNEGSQSVRHKEGREEEGRGQQNTVKEVILQATKIAAGSHCDKKSHFRIRCPNFFFHFLIDELYSVVQLSGEGNAILAPYPKIYTRISK